MRRRNHSKQPVSITPPSSSTLPSVWSFVPPHRAAQIATAASDVEGAPIISQASSLLATSSISPEQASIISNFAGVTLGVREFDSTYYSTVVIMAQALLGYEEEMQRLERKVKVMQIQLDGLSAIKRFEKMLAREHGTVTETGEKHVGGSLDEGGRVILERKVRKDLDKVEVEVEVEVEPVWENLMDMNEWPLPPSRKEWINAQGERKRKRQTR